MSVQSKNTRLARTVTVMVTVGALAWIPGPFYDWCCKVTGFDGVTSVAQSGSDEILQETIIVRFDASLARDMPWEFKPILREMELRIGETGLAFYEAYNPTDQVVAGTASFNVAPFQAGGHFTKISCFCFEQQILQPGERVLLPVTFFVSPAITLFRSS